MTNELLIGRRKLLLTAIIFGVGCLGLAAFFLIGISKSANVLDLVLDFIFMLGFGVLSHASFKKYSNLKN